MKIKKIVGQKYEVFSSSERCYQCKFQCEVVVKDMEKINIYCKHPKGPGNPEHCIYFKKAREDENMKIESN